MPNAITLAQQFVPMLDEVYQLACLTADLDGAAELARQGANANELIIPKISMDGLADYSRNGGYVGGDVTLTNETVKCNFDRGRMFDVDTILPGLTALCRSKPGPTAASTGSSGTLPGRRTTGT